MEALENTGLGQHITPPGYFVVAAVWLHAWDQPTVNRVCQNLYMCRISTLVYFLLPELSSYVSASKLDQRRGCSDLVYGLDAFTTAVVNLSHVNVVSKLASVKCRV